MDLKVETKQIERLTERIGEERYNERDAEVERYLSLTLVERKGKPEGVTAPAVAVVGVDGGRLQILERQQKSSTEKTEGKGKAKKAPISVAAEESLPPNEAYRGTHWREDKIGLLMTMNSEVSATDPCPHVPTAFVDPTRIGELTRGLKTKKSAAEVATQQEAAEETDHPEVAEEALREAKPVVYRQPPEMEEKHLVASRRPWPEFGPMVAARAWKSGFYAASRKAFLGDGSDNNWTIWRQHFSSFVPILDVIHAISYLFASAIAGQEFGHGWTMYVRWMNWLWQGEVEKIIAELAQRQAELGSPQATDGETHPRQVVATALGYLQNHKDKMRYAEYRRQGLPITSSYVESAVKQFNQRVKGTEKFWTEKGAEALLQLRADHLSDDLPMPAFWQRRQDEQAGINNYSTAA